MHWKQKNALQAALFTASYRMNINRISWKATVVAIKITIELVRSAAKISLSMEIEVTKRFFASKLSSKTYWNESAV